MGRHNTKFTVRGVSRNVLSRFLFCRTCKFVAMDCHLSLSLKQTDPVYRFRANFPNISLKFQLLLFQNQFRLSFLPSLLFYSLPSFLPSFSPFFLSSILPSLFSYFLPSFSPFLLPSFLLFFLTSFLPSF